MFRENLAERGGHRATQGCSALDYIVAIRCGKTDAEFLGEKFRSQGLAPLFLLLVGRFIYKPTIFIKV
jgi:hypothetical protein